MRIRDILGHLQEGRHLEVQVEKVEGAHPSAYRLKNRGRLAAALGRLRLVIPLQSEVQAAVTHPMMTAPSVATDTKQAFDALLGQLRRHASEIETILSGILSEQAPESFAVRIPPPETLQDLKSTLGDIHLVFQDPIKRHFEQQAPDLAVQGFDTGSEWIELCGYTGVVLKFMFAILWASNHYRQGAAKARESEARASVAEAGAELLAILADTEKKLLEMRLGELTKSVVEGFEQHRSKNANVNEVTNSVRQAVTTWARMLDQGATVKPALNAARDVREHFPDPDTEDLPQLADKLVKLLGDGTDKTS